MRVARTLVAQAALLSGVGAQAPAAVRGDQAPAPALSIEADDSAFAARIAELCGPAGSIDELLRDEDRLAAQASAGTAASYHPLACARAHLHARGAIAHERWVQPLGASWAEGGVRVLLKEVEAKDDAAVGDLLARLIPEERANALTDSVRRVLTAVVTKYAPSAEAARGCVTLNEAAGELALAEACNRVALQAGVDSIWQLIYAARLAARRADTSLTLGLLRMSLAVAGRHNEWGELAWHLKWFLTPAEWTEWLRLTDSVRATWIEDRFVTRDLRDGRPHGARVVEHFLRLDHAEKFFTIYVPRRVRGRLLLPATGQSQLPPDSTSLYWEPALVSAPAYRVAPRWDARYDDRAAIWMRFGKPSEVREWAGIDTVQPPKTLKPGREARYVSNVRAAWLYVLDGQRLILQFEPELFTRSTQPTRLVAGVLGSYLCGLDAWRCRLTSQAETAHRPGGRPVQADDIAALDVYDRATIASALARDDNSRRPEHPIFVLANLYRLWDGTTKAPLTIVPWAIPIKELEVETVGSDEVVQFAVELRSAGADSDSLPATYHKKRLRLPQRRPGDAKITGVLVGPATHSMSSWGVAVQQGPDRSGRAGGRQLDPIGGGAVTLSDLILGAPSQGQSWTSSAGSVVPLAPLGAFSRKEAISLYLQLRAVDRIPDAAITVAIYQTDRDGTAPALQIRFGLQIESGISEFQREVDVSRLKPGSYRMELVVTDKRSGTTVSRSAPLLVR
ncbi:MAG: hypothetical protein ABJC19_10965 [Gemmatimonadota bacterium]